MAERPLHVLATNVSSACAKFRAVVAEESQPALPGLSTTPKPSVAALTNLLREHEALLAQLGNISSNAARSDDQAEVAAVAAKREQVLAQGLDALGAVAISMRAVLDDVAELAPPDNGHLPTVQELLSYGHRLRYTTFATTGLFAGEPAPQQLHFDHAVLWERALAERHQNMIAGAAPGTAGTGAITPPAAPVDPRAEAACNTLLNNLVEAGWTPEAGFPEPVLAFLSDMPGALDVLRRLVEERFFGAAPAAATAGAAPPPPAAAGPRPAAPAANPASRLARELMLDEETDEEGSSSGYTTTEEGSD